MEPSFAIPGSCVPVIGTMNHHLLFKGIVQKLQIAIGAVRKSSDFHGRDAAE